MQCCLRLAAVSYFIFAVSNFQLQKLGRFTFLVAFAIHTKQNPNSSIEMS
jgi:hypothetical protein